MNKAVILAGGEGKRLRPFTLKVPKPMVPIVDRPILEYSIELLREYGITDIYITTCYKSKSIKDYFQDGSQFGVTISYLDEEVPLGTAGGLFAAKHFLNETFLVISGDAFTNINIYELYEFHVKQQATLTIVTKDVEDPQFFGVCFANHERKLEGFVEKPNSYIGNEVSTGIYLIEPEILSRYSLKENIDFSKDLLPVLLENNEQVFVYKMEDYWRDIGSVHSYKQAREDYLEGTVRFDSSQPTRSSVTKVEHFPRYITRVEVECPLSYKSFIFHRLLIDERFLTTDDHSVQIAHTNGGWTRIVDNNPKGFIIYSKAEKRNLSKEFAKYYRKKIKQWQKV